MERRSRNTLIVVIGIIIIIKMVSDHKIKAKINAISALSNLIAEMSLRTKWQTAGCT